jgi:hypothetical protein
LPLATKMIEALVVMKNPFAASVSYSTAISYHLLLIDRSSDTQGFTVRSGA